MGKKPTWGIDGSFWVKKKTGEALLTPIFLLVLRLKWLVVLECTQPGHEFPSRL